GNICFILVLAWFASVSASATTPLFSERCCLINSWLSGSNFIPVSTSKLLGGGSHTSATDTTVAVVFCGRPARVRSSIAASAHLEPSYAIKIFMDDLTCEAIFALMQLHIARAMPSNPWEILS